MLIREQNGYRFEIEIRLRGGRVADGSLNDEPPALITFRLAEGEWERFKAEHPELSEQWCRSQMSAIQRDLINRCGREGIRPGENTEIVDAASPALASA